VWSNQSTGAGKDDFKQLDFGGFLKSDAPDPAILVLWASEIAMCLKECTNGVFQNKKINIIKKKIYI